MRELVKCIDCGTPFHYTMGRHYCDKCQKIGTSVNMFANKRQPTNREINAARGRVRDRLVTAHEVLSELLHTEKIGVDDTVGALIRLLSEQIETHQ